MCIRDRQDPNSIPDSGSGVYIIFLIRGIIGYFTIPTVAEWVIQSGGAGGAMGGINKQADSYGVKLSASKGFNFLSTTLRTFGNYNSGNSQQIIQEEILNSKSGAHQPCLGLCHRLG